MLKTGNILIYKTPNNYMLLRVISCQYASYENEYKVRGSFWVTELIGGKVLFDKKQLNISSDNKYIILTKKDLKKYERCSKRNYNTISIPK